MKIKKSIEWLIQNITQQLSVIWNGTGRLRLLATSWLPIEHQDPRQNKRWYTQPTWVVHLGRPLARWLLRFGVQIHWSGLEHLPPQGAFILACNHASMIDPVILNAYLPRYPHFMSKKELFKHPVMAWVLRLSGAFPVDRGGGDEWAMAQARRILQTGSVLGIFPEGTRSRTRGVLGRGKTGAVRLALETGVPIVPVALVGTGDLVERYRNPLRPPEISIHIGAPLDVCSLIDQTAPTYEQIQTLTNELMQRIAQMLPPNQRGEYAA